MEEATEAITLRHVTLDVAGRRLFDGLDLEVRAGESVAIIGPSGSGKTTLLNLIAGIQLPDRGRVSTAGRDLVSMSANARAAHRLLEIGLVFQFAELLPELTVEENVAFPARLGGVSTTAARGDAARWLKRVGLDGLASARPATLSGGEAQRAAIARALAFHPSVVLADEPTGALDEDNGQQIAAALIGLARTDGIALVVVTHDHAIAARADRVLRLSGRRLEPWKRSSR